MFAKIDDDLGELAGDETVFTERAGSAICWGGEVRRERNS